MRWQDYLLLLLLAGACLFYLISQKRRKPKTRPRGRSSNQLTRREQAALLKLQVRGFKLDEIHPEVPVTIDADQKSKPFSWVGNFTVTKGGKTYLVKVVKEGSALSSASLRRELLLDHLIFQPAGLFLFSGDNEQLQDIDFTFDSGERGGSREKLLIRLALIFLILLGLVLLYRFAFQGGV